jgi:hypothetical protein
MKPVAYMAGLSAASWVVAAVIVERRTSIEILFGMLGPLFVACGTWLLTSWVYKERPTELNGLMVTAFFLKMVFFATYVAAMLRVMQFRLVPFIVSFTAYFIVLYLMEALYLRRLFSERSK